MMIEGNWEDMNKEMLTWTKKALKGEYGIYIYNTLLQLRRLIEWAESKHV